MLQSEEPAATGKARRSQPVAAIVADDLTGACDASVHFAVRGMKTMVRLQADAGPAGDAAVIAWNTNTRCLPSGAAAQVTSRSIQVAQKLGPWVLLQKIDSLLRGHVAEDIAAALAAAECPVALVAPAFPGVGRIVKDGWVHDQGDAAVEIAAQLKGLPCANVRREDIPDLAGCVHRAVCNGIKALIIDTADEQDLLCLARQQAKIPGVLWVGSGGLARALAAQLPGINHPQHPLGRRGPALICVGSDHPYTTAQVEQLSRDRSVVRLPADVEGYAHALEPLQHGRDVLLDFSRIAMQGAPDRALADLAGASGCGAFVLTGGDTALFVLRSLGASAIEMRSEVAPGVPWGEIRGGVAAGLPVITKSGGFGDAGTLVACLDFLSCESFAGRQET
ncbi:MAG TPA: four-carbon acid sugar kinase family protein [Acidobacteriaceae bacterium]|nr:four-carbon acid sugar kinase family protein [Acidobacteriaceae bacterium]